MEMSWAGVTFNIGLPVNGRRVPMIWIEDDSFYWTYDEDLYSDIY